MQLSQRAISASIIVLDAKILNVTTYMNIIHRRSSQRVPRDRWLVSLLRADRRTWRHEKLSLCIKLGQWRTLFNEIRCEIIVRGASSLKSAGPSTQWLRNKRSAIQIVGYIIFIHINDKVALWKKHGLNSKESSVQLLSLDLEFGLT